MDTSPSLSADSPITTSSPQPDPAPTTDLPNQQWDDIFSLPNSPSLAVLSTIQQYEPILPTLTHLPPFKPNFRSDITSQLDFCNSKTPPLADSGLSQGSFSPHASVSVADTIKLIAASVPSQQPVKGTVCIPRIPDRLWPLNQTPTSSYRAVRIEIPIQCVLPELTRPTTMKYVGHAGMQLNCENTLPSNPQPMDIENECAIPLPFADTSSSQPASPSASTSPAAFDRPASLEHPSPSQNGLPIAQSSLQQARFPSSEPSPGQDNVYVTSSKPFSSLRIRIKGIKSHRKQKTEQELGQIAALNKLYLTSTDYNLIRSYRLDYLSIWGLPYDVFYQHHVETAKKYRVIANFSNLVDCSSNSAALPFLSPSRSNILKEAFQGDNIDKSITASAQYAVGFDEFNPVLAINETGQITSMLTNVDFSGDFSASSSQSLNTGSLLSFKESRKQTHQQYVQSYFTQLAVSDLSRPPLLHSPTSPRRASGEIQKAAFLRRQLNPSPFLSTVLLVDNLQTQLTVGYKEKMTRTITRCTPSLKLDNSALFDTLYDQYHFSVPLHSPQTLQLLYQTILHNLPEIDLSSDELANSRLNRSNINELYQEITHMNNPSYFQGFVDFSTSVDFMLQLHQGILAYQQSRGNDGEIDQEIANEQPVQHSGKCLLVSPFSTFKSALHQYHADEQDEQQTVVNTTKICLHCALLNLLFLLRQSHSSRSTLHMKAVTTGITVAYYHPDSTISDNVSTDDSDDTLLTQIYTALARRMYSSHQTHLSQRLLWHFDYLAQYDYAQLFSNQFYILNCALQSYENELLATQERRQQQQQQLIDTYMTNIREKSSKRNKKQNRKGNVGNFVKRRLTLGVLKAKGEIINHIRYNHIGPHKWCLGDMLDVDPGTTATGSAPATHFSTPSHSIFAYIPADRQPEAHNLFTMLPSQDPSKSPLDPAHPTIFGIHPSLYIVNDGSHSRHGPTTAVQSKDAAKEIQMTSFDTSGSNWDLLYKDPSSGCCWDIDITLFCDASKLFISTSRYCLELQQAAFETYRELITTGSTSKTSSPIVSHHLASNPPRPRSSAPTVSNGDELRKPVPKRTQLKPPTDKQVLKPPNSQTPQLSLHSPPMESDYRQPHTVQVQHPQQLQLQIDPQRIQHLQHQQMQQQYQLLSSPIPMQFVQQQPQQQHVGQILQHHQAHQHAVQHKLEQPVSYQLVDSQVPNSHLASQSGFNYLVQLAPVPTLDQQLTVSQPQPIHHQQASFLSFGISNTLPVTTNSATPAIKRPSPSAELSSVSFSQKVLQNNFSHANSSTPFANTVSLPANGGYEDLLAARPHTLNPSSINRPHSQVASLFATTAPPTPTVSLTQQSFSTYGVTPATNMRTQQPQQLPQSQQSQQTLTAKTLPPINTSSQAQSTRAPSPILSSRKESQGNLAVLLSQRPLGIQQQQVYHHQQQQQQQPTLPIQQTLQQNFLPNHNFVLVNQPQFGQFAHPQYVQEVGTPWMGLSHQFPPQHPQPNQPSQLFVQAQPNQLPLLVQQQPQTQQYSLSSPNPSQPSCSPNNSSRLPK